MKILKAIASALAITLLAGSFAFAENRKGDRDEYKHKYKQNNGSNGRGPQSHRQSERQDNDRRPDVREQRGAGPDQQFYRGGRLPPQYRQQIYVVNNWHVHQLPPPPRGYHWLQSGGDYILVAIATGIIVQLILDSAY